LEAEISNKLVVVIFGGGVTTVAREVPQFLHHRTLCVHGVYHSHQIHSPYNTTLTWRLWKSVNRYFLLR